MLLQVVSIKDMASECFSQPSFVPTIGAAVRSFSDLLADSNSMCSKHPEDFVLFHVGVFNDELGFLQPLMHQDSEETAPVFAPVQLARALDYITPKVES